MHSVILDALENENSIENFLLTKLAEKGEEFAYFKLQDMNILPCRSCGSCAFKSPGKCVIEDDIHTIMRAIAPSSMIMMLSPIRFGGYSSQLKKVIDKFMPMSLPLYTVKDGHLLHPMRYGHKKLLAIGTVDKNLPEQEENFRKLVAANALNMQFSHKTLIFKTSDSRKEIEYEISNTIKEVSNDECQEDDRI